MKPETIAIHGGYETDPTTKSVAVPIYQTVAYEFDDAQHGADLFNLAVPGNIYSRIMNPTVDVIQALALAGGLTTFAESNEIKILRRSGASQELIEFRYADIARGRNLEQNIVLQSGDVVIVP